MKKTLLELATRAMREIAGVAEVKTLDQLRVKYLGRSGELTQILKGLAARPLDEKKKIGEAANRLKLELQALVAQKEKELARAGEGEQLAQEKIDVTLPGTGIKRGKLHPVTQVLGEVVDIFHRLGYSVAEGPEVETDYYNFEALNIPAEHPARDMWSTLYLSENRLLRTHTSPVQVRVFEKMKPPLRIIAPGRVYRHDMDMTHSPVFHQVEGFLVDTEVTFGDLKGTLTQFLHQFFGKEKKVRFRPSYFPFTEPSAEVDVECVMCAGGGCRVCKGTGWLEILGAGMIDPNVFRFVNYDSEKYLGFAFGVGIERLAMLRYGIDDIRLFFENDIRFLRQF